MLVQENAFTRTLKCVAVASAILFGLSLPTVQASVLEAQFEVRVTAARVNVRSEPTTKSDVLFQVARGETLHLVEDAGEWYLVETPESRMGYIYGQLVELIPVVEETPPIETPPAFTSFESSKTELADEWGLEEARERSYREKRRKGLYKLAGGAAAVVAGLVVARSSKPVGFGLLGAGGYFVWDGYKDRKEGQRSRQWTVLVQLDRDTKAVAYHLSW